MCKLACTTTGDYYYFPSGSLHRPAMAAPITDWRGCGDLQVARVHLRNLNLSDAWRVVEHSDAFHATPRQLDVAQRR
jgi:hypothetical protein